MANTVVEELIKEILKSEKLNELNVTLSDDEFDQYENNFYKGFTFNKNELREALKANNVKYSEFEDYLINEISWQKLVSGKYYRLTSTSKIEIEEIMLSNKGITEDVAKDIIIERQLDLKSNKMIRDMINEATIEYK